jgi:uncharacterized protein
VADAGGAQARLRAPASPVCRRAIGWWAAKSLTGTLVALALQGAVALAVLGADATPAPLVVTGGATALVGLVHVLVVPRARYRLHRWEVTDDAVHSLRGWARLRWRIAPITRVQTVDTEQGPLQRLFRLATVTVTTASSSGALRLDGLDADEAADLADRLTKATDAAGGDAT